MPEMPELIAQAWPPAFFNLKLERLIGQTDANADLVPPRSLMAAMRGVLAAAIHRLSDSAGRETLLRSLNQFELMYLGLQTYYPQIEIVELAKVPEQEAIWLLEDIGNQMVADCFAPPEAAGIDEQFTINILPGELRDLIRHGSVPHDVIALLIPDAGSTEVRLAFAPAAELCYFLAVSAIDCPADPRTSLLNVARQIVEQLGPRRARLPVRPFGKSQRRKKSTAGAAPVELGNDSVVRLKITLKSITPPIWRRIEVLNCSLDELDGTIQSAMGWDGGHLSSFKVQGEDYLVQSSFGEEMDDCGDAAEIQLNELIADGCKKFSYTYDFGDDWRHEIKVEKILKVTDGHVYPRCVDGARACPPEDCGGVWGYQELVEAMHDPQHPRHEELEDWLGGTFDPESFSPAAVSGRMGGV